MQRRGFLGSVGAVVVSGCTSLAGGDGPDGSGGDGGSRSTEPTVEWHDDHLGGVKYAVSVTGTLGGSGNLKFRKGDEDGFFYAITGNPTDRFNRTIADRGNAPTGPIEDGTTLRAEVPGAGTDTKAVSEHVVGPA